MNYRLRPREVRGTWNWWESVALRRHQLEYRVTRVLFRHVASDRDLYFGRRRWIERDVVLCRQRWPVVVRDIGLFESEGEGFSHLCFEIGQLAILCPQARSGVRHSKIKGQPQTIAVTISSPFAHEIEIVVTDSLVRMRICDRPKGRVLRSATRFKFEGNFVFLSGSCRRLIGDLLVPFRTLRDRLAVLRTGCQSRCNGERNRTVAPRSHCREIKGAGMLVLVL